MKEKDSFKTLNLFAIILSGVTLVSSSFLFFSQCNTKVQLSQISSILKKENFANRDSLAEALKIQHFEEQYYLNQ